MTQPPTRGESAQPADPTGSARPRLVLVVSNEELPPPSDERTIDEAMALHPARAHLAPRSEVVDEAATRRLTLVTPMPARSPA